MKTPTTRVLSTRSGTPVTTAITVRGALLANVQLSILNAHVTLTPEECFRLSAMLQSQANEAVDWALETQRKARHA